MNQIIKIECFAISAILLKKEDNCTKVLMLKRTGSKLKNEWCQVAGEIEKGETAFKAALREIYEETEIIPDRFYSSDYCEQYYQAERNCISIVPVFVGYVNHDQKVKINHEHCEYKWMTINEAMDFVPYAGQHELLRFIEREFINNDPTEWLKIVI